MAKIYFLAILLLVFCHFSHAQDDSAWEVEFENSKYSIYMGDSKNISLSLTNLNNADLIEANATIRIVSDSNILKVTKEIPLSEIEGDKWSGNFTIDAVFIGIANLSVEIVWDNDRIEKSLRQVRIVILHKSILGPVFMKYFKICVLWFYFVMYINFGVILELDKVKTIVRKPLRPCIAFVCNFVLSPLVRHSID